MHSVSLIGQRGYGLQGPSKNFIGGIGRGQSSTDRDSIVIVIIRYGYS